MNIRQFHLYSIKGSLLTLGLMLLFPACNGDSKDSNGTPLDSEVIIQYVPPSDTEAVEIVGSWIDECVEYNYASEEEETSIIASIINACELFSPPTDLNPDWKIEYCWAHLVGAIMVESAYTIDLVNASAENPVVGLLQDRFSSTVCEFNRQGPIEKVEAMGCTFLDEFDDHRDLACYLDATEGGGFWTTKGGSEPYLSWMMTVPCNIALGTWIYFMFATSEGSTETTYYPENICRNGDAEGANLAAGIMGHFAGPSKQWANITDLDSVPENGQHYIETVHRIMNCALGDIEGTHPLFIPLVPNISQYCK